MLVEIEHIDDEADGAGIDFVKIDDKQMAKELGVFALPAVVFFKMGSKEPVIYAGGALYISKFLLLLVYVILCNCFNMIMIYRSLCVIYRMEVKFLFVLKQNITILNIYILKYYNEISTMLYYLVLILGLSSTISI